MRAFMTLFILANILHSATSLAETNLTNVLVPSGSTLNWTKEMSPINVNGQINLYGALTIEAGAEVVFSGENKITLWNGAASSLRIDGTGMEPVIIRAAGRTPWAGISVPGNRSTRPVIRITNAVLSNMGSYPWNFELRNADIVLKSSLFQSTRGHGSTSSTTGINAGTAIGVVSDCIFDGQTNGIEASDTLEVTNTEIRNTITPIAANNKNIKISLAHAE